MPHQNKTRRLLRQVKEWRFLTLRHGPTGYHPSPKDKRGVVYDELSDEDKKKIDAARFKEIDNLLIECFQCHDS